MAVAYIANIPSRAGYIDYDGSSYTAYPAATFCQNGLDPDDSKEERAYFTFDTSVIPTGSTVTGLRILLSLDSIIAAGDPDSWQHLLYIGDIIGAGLTTDDWTGGLLGAFKSWTGDPATGWISFTWNIDQVNDTGYTDVMMQDVSNWSAPTNEWTCKWKNSSSQCLLEVTYTEPPATTQVIVVT